jgi:hypothetical protein
MIIWSKFIWKFYLKRKWQNLLSSPLFSFRPVGPNPAPPPSFIGRSPAGHLLPSPLSPADRPGPPVIPLLRPTAPSFSPFSATASRTSSPLPRSSPYPARRLFGRARSQCRGSHSSFHPFPISISSWEHSNPPPERHRRPRVARRFRATFAPFLDVVSIAFFPRFSRCFPCVVSWLSGPRSSCSDKLHGRRPWSMPLGPLPGHTAAGNEFTCVSSFSWCS